MGHSQKLDTIIIEDSFSLPESELFCLALEIAEERAMLHGWSAIEVKRSISKPFRKDSQMCFLFDVYGIEAGVIDPSGAEKTIEGVVPRKLSASPDSSL